MIPSISQCSDRVNNSTITLLNTNNETLTAAIPAGGIIGQTHPRKTPQNSPLNTQRTLPSPNPTPRKRPFTTLPVNNNNNNSFKPPLHQQQYPQYQVPTKNEVSTSNDYYNTPTI